MPKKDTDVQPDDELDTTDPEPDEDEDDELDDPAPTPTPSKEIDYRAMARTKNEEAKEAKRAARAADQKIAKLEKQLADRDNKRETDVGKLHEQLGAAKTQIEQLEEQLEQKDIELLAKLALAFKGINSHAKIKRAYKLLDRENITDESSADDEVENLVDEFPGIVPEPETKRRRKTVEPETDDTDEPDEDEPKKTKQKGLRPRQKDETKEETELPRASSLEEGFQHLVQAR